MSATFSSCNRAPHHAISSWKSGNCCRCIDNCMKTRRGEREHEKFYSLKAVDSVPYCRLCRQPTCPILVVQTVFDALEKNPDLITWGKFNQHQENSNRENSPLRTLILEELTDSLFHLWMHSFGRTRQQPLAGTYWGRWRTMRGSLWECEGQPPGRYRGCKEKGSAVLTSRLPTTYTSGCGFAPLATSFGTTRLR